MDIGLIHILCFVGYKWGHIAIYSSWTYFRTIWKYEFVRIQLKNYIVSEIAIPA